VSLGAFALVPTNLFSLLIWAEVVWVGLYSLAGIAGVVVDELNCFGLSFFILGLASVELCVGLMMLAQLRHLRVALNLSRGASGVSRRVAKSALGGTPGKLLV